MTIGDKVEFDLAPGMVGQGYIYMIFAGFEEPETIFYMIAYFAGGHELTYVVRREGQFHAI